MTFPQTLVKSILQNSFVSRKLFRLFTFACIRFTESLPLVDLAVIKLEQSHLSNTRCAKSKAG